MYTYFNKKYIIFKFLETKLYLGIQPHWTLFSPKTFKESCLQFYHAELEQLSFAKAAEQSRKHINTWVSKKTEGQNYMLLFCFFFLPSPPSPFPAASTFPYFPSFSSLPSSSPCFSCCSDFTSVSDGQSHADRLGLMAYLDLNGLTVVLIRSSGFQQRRLNFFRSPGTRMTDTNVKRNS